MPSASIRPCHRLALASIVALAALPGVQPAAASPQAPLPPEGRRPAQASPPQAAGSHQATAPAQPASVSLPDSRPGRLMAEWLALCDQPDAEQMTRWYRAHLGKGAKGDVAKAAAAKDVARCEAAGGYQVTRVEVDEASQLAVFVVGRRGDARSRLTLALDADGRIAAPQPAAGAPASARPPVDVTGSWTGNAVLEGASGNTRLVRVEAELRAEGTRVSGSVTLSPPPAPSAPGELPLTSGAVAGKRLMFSAERNVVVYLFDLTIVSADRIEGSVTSDSHGEEQSTGRITFVRSSK